MRRRIEALADQLEEFVSEDGHDALVIRGDHTAAGVLGAALDLLQQRGSIDVFIPLFDAFEGPDALGEKLLTHVEAFADQGVSPRSTGGTPHSRTLDGALDALVGFAGAVRGNGDVRVALWLCPSTVSDEHGYLATALRLVRACRRRSPALRVGVRDTPDGALRSALRSAALAALEVDIDMSARAVRDALLEDAADPSGEPVMRATALVAVAMADAASGHEQDALSVLTTLAQVFATQGDTSSRALCFVLVGDVLARLDRLDEARARVSQGLALAIEGRSAHVALTGAILAGELSLRAADLADADVRFEVAARIAARIGAPEIVADALVRRGKVLDARSMHAAARDVWLCAGEAARRAGSVEHELAALSCVAALYRAAGMSAELDAVTRRLEALGARRGGGCPHHEHVP